MDTFYNYKQFMGFWWLLYLQYAQWISESPEYRASNGFDLSKYFKTKEGKIFKAKFERIAWD